MVGIKYNHLNYLSYKYLQGCDKTWHCFSFPTMLFPFRKLNNQKILFFINANNNNNNNNNSNNNSTNNSSTNNKNNTKILKTTYI